MNSNPEVSVIMAVYNASKYLNEAIDSILFQSLRNIELIIINDGSSDNSLELIKAYDDKRIIIVDQKNTGVATARNNGIKISRAKYIAIQDSDDISMNHRLEKQYNFILNNNNIILIGSNAEVVDEKGEYIFTTDLLKKNNDIKNNIEKMPFVGPSIFFEKKTFLKVGGYPDYMENTFEDLILINRMKNYGEMANLNNPMIKYRITPFSLTQRDKLNEKKLNAIVAKAIEFDSINNSEIDFLRNRLKKLPDNKRKVNYHIFLMKKFLFNNYNIKYAFYNWLKAIKLNPYKFSNYYYLGILFIPKFLIIIIYRSFKSIQGE